MESCAGLTVRELRRVVQSNLRRQLGLVVMGPTAIHCTHHIDCLRDLANIAVSEQLWLSVRFLSGRVGWWFMVRISLHNWPLP